MKQVTIDLFTFDELNESAKNKALIEHKTFLRKECNEVRSNKEVEENILANEYYFFENGELAHTTRYVGKHILAGKEEFHIKGNTYNLGMCSA